MLGRKAVREVPWRLGKKCWDHSVDTFSGGGVVPVGNPGLLHYTGRRKTLSGHREIGTKVWDLHRRGIYVQTRKAHSWRQPEEQALKCGAKKCRGVNSRWVSVLCVV